MRIEHKILKLAMLVNELTRRSQLQQHEKTASESRLNELVPKTVKALVDNGRIYPNQVEKVAAAIRDHNAALELLAAVAAHRNSDESTLGQPVKTAATQDQPATRRMPGQPITDYGTTPAGRKFEERILGLAAAN